MRLTEIDENFLQWGLDWVNKATKGVRSKSRMAQAKANPPRKQGDNRTRRRSGGSDDMDHIWKNASQNRKR